MFYVALTRTRNKHHVNFGNIATHKPYTGSVYRASINGRSCIGSAKDIKKRWAEHKDGKGHSKFVRALIDHGYKAFKWEVLETIEHADINDLFRLEEEYIDKYNSIECGFNSRYNIQSNTLEVNT